jgi:hypothetical protein
MELKEGDYILGFWVLEAKDMNWLCCVVKRDGKWIGEYRFRYYQDNKTFHSKDKKSFYRMEIKGDLPEEQVLSGIDTVVESFRPVFKATNYDKVLVQSSDIQKAMFKLAQLPCMNMKSVHKDDTEELEKLGIKNPRK